MKPENLREISDHALAGLTADASLKHRILSTAAGGDAAPASSRRFSRLIPVLLSSAAVMLLCVFLLNGLVPVPPEAQELRIHSFSAGDSASPLSFQAFLALDGQSLVSMELVSVGKTEDPALLSRLTDALQASSPAEDASDVDLEDRLILRLSGGRAYTLPAAAPYIAWEDGTRDCESFFALFPAAD